MDWPPIGPRSWHLLWTDGNSNMKRIVKYTPKDCYYQEFTEAYIGSTAEEVDDIQYETEEFISREHASLGMIYHTDILYDDTSPYLHIP